MAELHKVVLLGGSGVLGSAILRALQTSNRFEITVLSRVDSQATFSPGVRVIKSDYSQASLQQAFQGQDAVVCATGLGTISQQKTMIDTCIATGVKRYITNDFGNPEDFQGLPELEFARKPKQEILAYVKQQADAHPSFTWSALATGHFLDYAIKKFPAFGFTIADRSARLVDGGAEPFSATTLDDIGQAVAGILTHPKETANRYLLVRTLETTQNEILRAFEEQTGTSWKVEHIKSQQLLESGRLMQSRGERGSILELLPVQIFEKGIDRSTLPKARYDNDLLGVTEQTADAVVRGILQSI